VDVESHADVVMKPKAYCAYVQAAKLNVALPGRAQ
jgi:hypothetical protein